MNKINFPALLLSAILISYSVSAQESKTFNITPELSYITIQNNKIDFQIISAQYKEVDYPIYIEGEIPSKKYNEELKKLDKFKDEFDKYGELYKKAEQEYIEVKRIDTLIDEYLNSKERKEVKDLYLADAQKIVDQYGLQTTFSSGNVYKADSKIVLYGSANKVKKDDLKFYQTYIQTYKFKEPKKSQGYLNYVSQLRDLEQIKPTEKGNVLSKETIKKTVLIPDTLSVITYKDMNGVYSLLPEKYYIRQHLKNSSIKYEAIAESEPNSQSKTEPVQVIKANNSDKFYMIFSKHYLSSLERESSKEKVYFTFVKPTISRIEYFASVRNDYEFETPELKKRMLGIFPIKQIDEAVNYNESAYVKFASIPSDEKFLMITNSEYGHKNYSENLIIQNVRTKQLYVVSAYAMRTFQDHSNMGNEKNGNGWLTKLVPKELTVEEKELVKRYKTLISNGEGKTKILHSIQKKNLTKWGYFDPFKVNSSDKILYNKTIEELSIIYKKLQDINLYEDKNSVAELSLSIEELASYFIVKDWYNKGQKLN